MACQSNSLCGDRKPCHMWEGLFNFNEIRSRFSQLVEKGDDCSRHPLLHSPLAVLHDLHPLLSSLPSTRHSFEYPHSLLRLQMFSKIALASAVLGAASVQAYTYPSFTGNLLIQREFSIRIRIRTRTQHVLDTFSWFQRQEVSPR